MSVPAIKMSRSRSLAVIEQSYLIAEGSIRMQRPSLVPIRVSGALVEQPIREHV